MCFWCVFWCVFDLFLMCFWCVFDVFLMCFWCVFDVFLMCFWCVFDVFLMRFWCIFNVFLMCFWCVCFWCVFDVFLMCLLRIFYEFDVFETLYCSLFCRFFNFKLFSRFIVLFYFSGFVSVKFLQFFPNVFDISILRFRQTLKWGFRIAFISSSTLTPLFERVISTWNYCSRIGRSFPRVWWKVGSSFAMKTQSFRTFYFDFEVRSVREFDDRFLCVFLKVKYTGIHCFWCVFLRFNHA